MTAICNDYNKVEGYIQQERRWDAGPLIGGAPPPGGEVPIWGAAPSVDLTLIKQSSNKKRYAVLYSPKLGKCIVIDQVKARYDRMRKRIKAWADVLGDIPKARMIMIGLTYRPGEEQKPNDIREFMSLVKRKLGAGLYGYAWVGELQGRGAVHYHVILYLAKGAYMPKPDKSGWWRHGSTSITKAKSPYYVLSYTKKEYQKDYSKFPKNLRAFGVWIREDLLKEKLRYLSLKKWEKDIVDMDGWESLPFWKKLEKELNDWRFAGAFSEVEEAEQKTEYWLEAIQQLSGSPPLEPCPSPKNS